MNTNLPKPQASPEAAGAGSAIRQVLLVRLQLTATESECQQLTRLLASDEQERAARRLPAVRRRAVVSRGRLRQLLGRLLDMSPQAVPLVTNPHGKPELGGGHADSLVFNLSHSGDEGLIAVTCQGRIGIDLEVGKPTQDAAWARLMAGTIFAPEELDRWYALPEHRATAAILDAWVAKEAIFKAAGTGIGDRLRQCQLPLELPRSALADAGCPCRCDLIPVKLPVVGASGPQEFGLTLLSLGDAHHAAIACQASSAVITVRSFHDSMSEGLA